MKPVSTKRAVFANALGTKTVTAEVSYLENGDISYRVSGGENAPGEDLLIPSAMQLPYVETTQFVLDAINDALPSRQSRLVNALTQLSEETYQQSVEEGQWDDEEITPENMQALMTHIVQRLARATGLYASEPRNEESVKACVAESILMLLDLGRKLNWNLPQAIEDRHKDPE